MLAAQEQKLLVGLQDLVLSELNLKELYFLKDGKGLVVENVKPNLKRLGAKLGKKMPQVTSELKNWGAKEILSFEKSGTDASKGAFDVMDEGAFRGKIRYFDARSLRQLGSNYAPHWALAVVM